jgi:XTP/dITP diphosphohydrolase
VSRRLAPGATLVVATHNPGKLREIDDLVAPFGLKPVSASALGLPEPEETATTFAGNAELKAAAAARLANLPALADDSGLEVDSLGGAPGVHSARWAGPEKDFGLAMDRVAAEISARGGWPEEGSRAHFTCALALVWPDAKSQVYEGKVFGRLVWPPRGNRGFGYDPMFLADGEELTFGEMEPARKHATSHRARAFALFVRDGLEVPKS